MTTEQRLNSTRQSLDQARRNLEEMYLGTPCEPDYREMIERYEERVAELEASL